MIGAGIRAIQRLQTDDADDKQEHGQEPERDDELGPDRYRQARNKAREAVYAFSSFCIWRKNEKSVSATI
jgi:hypothetical protein